MDPAGVDIGSGIDADGLDIGPDAGVEISTGQEMDFTHGAGAGQASAVQKTGASDTAGSPSPFSPVVMASAITTFGAVGIISMKGFGLSGLASTFVALAFAGAMGAAIFFGIVKFMYGSQSNSIFSLNDLIGTEAEVITPVPAKGLGEIAYTINGIRYTLSARSLEECEIHRGTPVIIREIAGNTAVVQQKLTIDDIEVEEGVLKRRGELKEAKDRQQGN
ncbi:MAG TPA: NfeD family protein [Clostridiales bacterium]|nr:NfeD family protein [Clostridiales bacterium]